MTDETINALVATRNRLTDRRDEMIDMDAVDLIDAILREVPAGQRNDVDLLLGRTCAVLPPRAALQAACQENGVKAQWYQAQPLSDDDYEHMSAGKPDGMIEHDDWLAGAP